ncbi:hypothetical protein EYZ11_004117 [Aspergillus tanneri]|uniref:Uncharacterized protein n=1 Tax=Aspergillus tanneri TaxID=1220188 RepID=A0A4S3JLY5_9EURO|nr:hypothetical protein EYZ11_004117 [Aspergillus tanneri]
MASSDDFTPPLPSESLHERFSKLGVGSMAFVNTDVMAYFTQPRLEGHEPWLRKPEVPTPEEIMDTDCDENSEYIELIPNKIMGPWKSKEEYLKAHYELLREDAVAPLRDAVAYVKNDPQMSDSQSVAIYEKVTPIALPSCR